ncbi:MAG: hypothetical protein NC121_16845 [Blautia sp.]|nr:hypothetical protein [Blautia sp.]
MTNNELLLAISNMLDSKLKAELQPIKNEMQDIRNEIQGMKGEIQIMKGEIQQMKLFQENVIMPRLNTIESCYTDTFRRYRDYTDRMDDAFQDIDILKNVVTEHSEKLQKIS